jgi:class 3 adenylate cyclase
MDDWGKFIEAGIYDPGAPKAAERREFLQFLLDGGHAVEDIVAAARADAGASLFRITNRLSVRSRPLLRACDVAARVGAGSAEDVAELRAAFSMPVSDLAAAEIPESFVDSYALFLLASELYGRDRCLGLARVIGASVVAMAEAGREVVLTPLVERGATELEIAHSNDSALESWRQVVTLVANLMYEQTGRSDWFADELLRGSFVMAVAFVDLVESTQWSASIGAASHADALARFEYVAASAAASAGCRVVKFIGDEAMLVGRDAAALAEVAAHVCAFAAADDVLPGARAAVGYGPVTPRAGDYFGDVVNIVARATKEADPNGVVVTTEVATRLARTQWTIGEPRQVSLRGVAGEVELFDVALVT